MTIAGVTADVVVAGGGVIGLSCVACLPIEGLRVVLVERGGLGSGTSRTGQSGGGVGLQTKDWDLEWHRTAIATFAEMANEGLGPAYRADGALIVCNSESAEADCRAAGHRLSSASALLTGRLVADILFGGEPPLDPAPVAANGFQLQ